MKEIPVLKDGIVVAHSMVDDYNYDRLSTYKWFFAGDNYVARLGIGHSNIYMHNDVKVCLPLCDHEDGNKLNNQESNLRSATKAQNNRNRGKGKNNTTGYKGVSFNLRALRYQARIMAGGKNLYLGGFETAEEAAKAYDTKAKEVHGEFAQLNFPE